MEHWLETLLHRIEGHIAVSVTRKDGTGEPDSLWAIDVLSENNELVVDVFDGTPPKRYPLAEYDFLVTP